MRLGLIGIGLCGAIALAGCAATDVPQRVALAERIAAEHRFSKIDIQTEHFRLAAFIGPQEKNRVLHVYIEGDGFAWVTRYKPSRDPTPREPVALDLAVLDSRNAAYLARPCQYVMASEVECPVRYWTSDRFSPEVINSMNEAVTQLKGKAGADRLVLVGYSGGGAVAALVAARRADVIQLVTVAGNLDHRTWTRLHKTSELTGSLNPPDSWRALVGIPQTHFIGKDDHAVPAQVYRAYRKAFPESADIHAEILPDVDHRCCWADVWPTLLRQLR